MRLLEREPSQPALVAAEAEQSVSVPPQTHWSNYPGDVQVQHSFCGCCHLQTVQGLLFALFLFESTLLGGKIEQKYMSEITRVSRRRNLFEYFGMDSLPFRVLVWINIHLPGKNRIMPLYQYHWMHHNTWGCFYQAGRRRHKCLDLSGSLAMPPKPPGHFTAVLQKEYFHT